MAQRVTETSIKTWGNSLALRLSKSIVGTAGLTEGTPVRVIVQPGKIIIEAANRKLTLDEMLAAFDKSRHSGEVMAFTPVGTEVS